MATLPRFPLCPDPAEQTDSPATLRLVLESGALIGGMPGQGKSAAMRRLLLQGALDGHAPSLAPVADAESYPWTGGEDLG